MRGSSQDQMWRQDSFGRWGASAHNISRIFSQVRQWRNYLSQKNIRTFNSPCVRFIPELCMMAGITENVKAEIATLIEFINTQCICAELHAALVSMRRPNTRSHVGGYGVLVRSSSLYGALQQVVPASIRFLFLHHWYCNLLPVTLGSVACTTPWEACFTGTIWLGTQKLQNMTAVLLLGALRMANDNGTSNCSFP